ncbi:MAG TPA: hypothetical protein VMH22_13765 [bacterium]|nr:hypothetical protein [bacterium]
MADPVKSAARWKAKYKVERVKDTLNDHREGMALRYEAAMTELCAMETNVREVINACGVSTSQHVPCLSFGRQLYKLSRQRHISGESFAMAVQVLLGKRAARGCDPRVLAKIRTDVFDIGEPAKRLHAQELRLPRTAAGRFGKPLVAGREP